MNGGYESLVWVTDTKGSEFACPIEAIKGDVSKRRELTEEEKAQCLNVNELIGTERW